MNIVAGTVIAVGISSPSVRDPVAQVNLVDFVPVHLAANLDSCRAQLAAPDR
jgi:hypothetical protein